MLLLLPLPNPMLAWRLPAAGSVTMTGLVSRGGGPGVGASATSTAAVSAGASSCPDLSVAERGCVSPSMPMLVRGLGRGRENARDAAAGGNPDLLRLAHLLPVFVPTGPYLVGVGGPAVRQVNGTHAPGRREVAVALLSRIARRPGALDDNQRRGVGLSRVGSIDRVVSNGRRRASEGEDDQSSETEQGGGGNRVSRCDGFWCAGIGPSSAVYVRQREWVARRRAAVESASKRVTEMWECSLVYRVCIIRKCRRPNESFRRWPIRMPKDARYRGFRRVDFETVKEI